LSSADHTPGGEQRRGAPGRPARKSGRAAAVLCALALSRCAPSASPSGPSYPEKDRAAEATRLLAGPDWYRHAIFYEVYVRSFQDSGGDGIGDLPGLTSRLDTLKALGVDALWLMPIMPSPFADSGYDVSDYRSIDPAYGTMADFDALLAAAHARGMRVLVDFVVNHTSVAHPWFQESRQSRTNPKADWYVWSDTPGRPDVPCGVVPTFGTSAWTFDPVRGQYYFHRFYPAQPDLDYWEPAVVAATLDVARFWLDRGVDGFRCDAIGFLYESAAGCDMIPETVAYIQQLRRVLDGYPGRAMVAEAIGFGPPTAYFGNGQDMFHMAFDFDYAFLWDAWLGGGSAQPIADHFSLVLQALPAGAQSALAIGSHDVPRAFARANGIASRWRRAALVQMTMPGTPFIYYGEELALRPGSQVVVDGRDLARTPMLWRPPPLPLVPWPDFGWGFTTGSPWIAFGAEPERTNLEIELSGPGSDYAFYSALLGLRRGREAFGTGTLRILPTDDPSVLLYVRESADESYVVAVGLDEGAWHSAAAAGANLPGDPELLFGDASLASDGAAARVTMPPAGMGVFRVR
jgi:alpha-glucosidase